MSKRSWEVDFDKLEFILQEDEEKYRVITDNVIDNVACLDRNNNITYINPSVRTLLGYEPDELLSTNVFALIKTEDRRKIIQLFKNIVPSNPEVRTEYRLLQKNGNYLWVESVSKAIFDDDGNIIEYIVATRDISKRKQAEEELKNQLHYIWDLLDNMSEFFITYDKNLKLTYVNRKALEITGYTAEEILGTSILNFATSSKDREKIVRQVSERLIGRESSYNLNITCRNGNKILVRLKSAPLIRNNEIVGGLVLGEDITEYTKMQKEMNRLAQLHIIGEIAAGIGHEIRNPMTTVRGFLQMMSNNESLQVFKPNFDIMLEELDRANAIISEFLSLARNKMVNLQLQDLNKIVVALFPLLQADAMVSDKWVTLDLSVIPKLMLDEKEIRQLILNLVRNGLEAMEPGGKIVIRTISKGECVKLIVEDEGCGIPLDVLDKLGTPFVTTKEDGTGLGLPVCYGIVSRHKGQLDVETNDKGTKFIISFPIPELKRKDEHPLYKYNFNDH